MRNLRLEIEAETKRYSTLLAEGRKSVRRMANQLTSSFEHYAGEFLAEKCKLAYRQEKRRLGEEGELLEYPNFHVEMTSAVSPKLGTARNEDTEVSESQKEFVDLAFRMALFDAVRQPKDGVMLVIETPEASLDSIFVEKAGNLLRKFAEAGAGEPNVIITSCNLNGTGIVRSLLGVDTPEQTRNKRRCSEKNHQSSRTCGAERCRKETWKRVSGRTSGRSPKVNDARLYRPGLAHISAPSRA